MSSCSVMMTRMSIKKDGMIPSDTTLDSFSRYTVTKNVKNEHRYIDDQMPLLNGTLKEPTVVPEESADRNHHHQQCNGHSVLSNGSAAPLTDDNAGPLVSSADPLNSLKSRKNLNQLLASRFQDDFKPSHQLGPDHVMAADGYWTTEPDRSVKLRVGFTGINALAPKSIITVFRERVEKSGDNPSMSVKRDGVWQHWTYNEYWQDICIAAKGFLKLGLERYHSVAMLGFNAPEWVVSLMATVCAGGLAVGIYPTNNPEACKYVLEHSRANIVVVENPAQLQKIIAIRDELPHLKAIIQYLGTPAHEDVFSWNDLLEVGRTVSDECLHTRIKSLAVNQAAVIVYTSGTTGNPKAVMLSHDNIISGIEFLNQYISLVENEESVVSFLPLNHVAAQIVDIYLLHKIGGRVYFAKPDALKGSLVETLVEVKPSFMLAVPRVVEKFKEKLDDAFSNINFIKRTMIKLAMKNAYKYSNNVVEGHLNKPYTYRLVEPLIKKLQAAMGLNKVKNFFCAGAPISTDTLKFFLKLNIIICEAYGMTETCGSHTMNSLWDFKLGSVGKKSIYNDLKLVDMTHNGGEICCRGRGVFMGYMFEFEKTQETFDEDCWLHSGDLGKLDKDDYMSVTGRLKELVITAAGENIAPLLIEDNVKIELPLVSQAVVIGDKRKYLCMLLTIKTEMDTNTMLPTDKLTPLSIKWCRNLGSNVENIQDILQDNRILKAIQEGIDKANEKAISNACRVQKWHILSRDFTPQSNEMGPTMKLKRSVITDRYKDIIEAFYA